MPRKRKDKVLTLVAVTQCEGIYALSCELRAKTGPNDSFYVTSILSHFKTIKLEKQNGGGSIQEQDYIPQISRDTRVRKAGKNWLCSPYVTSHTHTHMDTHKHTHAHVCTHMQTHTDVCAHTCTLQVSQACYWEQREESAELSLRLCSITDGLSVSGYAHNTQICQRMRGRGWTKNKASSS